ncbi:MULTISPECIES: 3-carboxy-cis,cis-muconate cycloisomerase [unclassified Ruegeria]|uniref:3-carboxy-cis,cis-muconate cycloisomerase n=1 Tax=unclassified Ruegeria TaxID=2625375 RepID=UPI001ADAF448|nr:MULTISPECIES: 3-carboxy-cis,cis-muconate cycloisomerase [unclassified Ruegeria]MBO9412634.1 3-carboxy-cis,cis-muconate cycloisomerase [Ruegeria sp. R8_1]MBO9416128.1 3-carboxy-cis,cis-muconate cycloisomerase [Ruegeria sp. R8_2]
MTDLFSHPWFSGLFGDPEAQEMWSAERSLAHMLAFEAAYSRGLGATGKIPADQADAAAAWIEQTAPGIETLRAGTMADGLPVPALVQALRSDAGPLAPAIHTGTTSQDVMDTALALTLRETTDLLQERLLRLSVLLGNLSEQFGERKIMGRTRMQAALPVTVGHRIETWRDPLRAYHQSLSDLRHRVECVQLAGPVGDGQTIGPAQRDLAKHIADALGLHVADQSWHTARDRLVEYADLLSRISGSLGKMGQDICLMAQQGVDEITLSGGGASSAMPHKQNPILAELLVTLARFNATQVSGMHHALVHEQERSGSAWALEWMILPTMAQTTARSLTAATTLCTQIVSVGAASA